MNRNKHSIHGLLCALALSVLSLQQSLAAEPVALMHVHGLSYSGDGARLMIPSHQGLAIYENGRWTKAAGPAHDYMGFSATRKALYSSGHPAPGSGLTNPFGLVKSQDGGKTWQKLGLEGESDFHTLATGYDSGAVYVLNHGPNSRMAQPGIYHSRNDGFKWTRAAASGLAGDPVSIAVHPSDPNVVAVGTSDGLYLSRNSGETFARVVSGQRVLAEAFDLSGGHLWFSTHAGKATLARMALQATAKVEMLPMPELPDDAVAYIAQNPVRHDEMSIATFKRNVYLSKDAGRTWTQIATNGVTHDRAP